MLTYATVNDVADWVDVPVDIDPLIRAASILVRDATKGAMYDVDGAGKPADPEISDALRDATCAQIAVWASAGIDPRENGVAIGAPSVVSKSMGGRSVQYADLSGSVTVQQDRARAARELCSQSRAILASAGLLSGLPAASYG